MIKEVKKISLVKRPKGEFFVMWHVIGKNREQGLIGGLIKNNTSVNMAPVIQRYNTMEMAEKVFDTVKQRGAYRPFLFKLVKEE